MMNAAMMIAPAPQTGNVKAGGKAAAGQGQLFGQAMAQQDKQAVFQTAEQGQAGLFGLPGKGVLLSSFPELLGEDAGQLLDLQPQQQDLLEQMDADMLEQMDVEMLEQMDVEMLEDLALLLEQGMVPDSMDHAQLQQLVDLVEEVLPEWQLHSQVVAARIDEQDLPELQVTEAGQNEVPLDQKVEELIAWFSQYQAQPQQQTRIPSASGKEISGEFPPGQLVAAQQLEQVRERLMQLRTTPAQAGTDAVPVKAEGEAKGTQMATTGVRGADLPARLEPSDSSLEARFSELLKPRQAQAGQVPEGGRQAQSLQQGQQTSVNPAPVDDAGGFFTNVLDKSAPQVALAQNGMNVRQVIDGLHPQHNHLHGQPVPVPVTAQGITAPVAVAAPFAASQQAADSQIFDQVVTHLSGSDKGDMGRMVLRLHPAELGSLRIELMVEGDRVRANLHAQTQQVQEVLERNLGQLRNSLAEQGLKIDHFQVSSDARQSQQQGQADNLAHQRHGAEQAQQHRRSTKEEPLREDQAIPLAHLTQNGGRGISLHV
jgi:flagellar hook-length control protein FliK